MAWIIVSSDLRFLPRFLPTQRRLCIVALGFFYRPAAFAEDVEERRQKGESDEQAGGGTCGHDTPETLDALVFGDHQAAKARDGGQAGDQHRFTCTLGQDAWMLLLSEADLDGFARSLNNRPRQTLGFMKPSERLSELLALTG